VSPSSGIGCCGLKIFPVIIVNQSGGTAEQAATMINMSMLVIGLTTVLQALRKGPFGSG